MTIYNMKLTKKIRNIGVVIATAACCLTSCDYLDVVPPEQPNLKDAMSSPTRALGFLYSCYAGTNIDLPTAYLGEINSTTDEYVLPQSWGSDGYWGAYAFNTASSTNQNWLWGSTYQYVGQCYLFLQELEKVGNDIATEEEKKLWKAECKFLVAYYHFVTLRRYGPIPITDSYIPMNTPTSEYNGRFHFDYCVDWIANQLDEAAKDLPAIRTSTNEWGRATSTIAKAVKARLLLYAASPLWNGSFPYPNWKNEKFETPGYGKELVSTTYSKDKWDRALAACQEALALALGEGKRELYNDTQYFDKQGLGLPYVPGVANVPDNVEFLKNVMKMRYAVTTRENEGNKETIWGLSEGFDMYSRYPLRIIKTTSGTWSAGYSGVAPTLYTFEHFYTANGKLPAKDPKFTPSSEWFESANVADREEIIKLNVGREPRFYAWMAFDGGDYGSKFKGGEPLKLEMRNSELHGYNPSLFNRDHSTTGFLTQKFVDPLTEFYEAGGSTSGTSAPTILFRLAELYLNVAECYAALDQPDKAIENLNPIRKRAGIPELTLSDVTADMKAMDWVRNERFVELWNEGHRFFDVRRWALGTTYFAAGKREGLNAESKTNPTFEEFNQRVKINAPYTWENRMYLNPVFYNEVYKNPQMVQAPGY